MKSKILVATPASLRQDRHGEIYETLDLWLKSIEKLEYTYDTYIYFNDFPVDIINKYMPYIEKKGYYWESADFGYAIDARTHSTRILDETKPYERYCVVRNHLLDISQAYQYDYLVSIDSDVLVRPNLITRLIQDLEENSLTMVSALVDNSIRSRKIEFDQHAFNYGTSNKGKDLAPTRKKKIKWDSLIPCDYTGACFLLSMQDVNKYNIRYIPHVHGEDLSFCLQLASKKLKIAVDTSRNQECYHVQEPWLTKGAEKYLEGMPVEEAYRTKPEKLPVES